MVSSCNSYYIGDEGKRMAALLGRIGEFDFKVENWKQYIERLGHFFDANGITDEGKQRSVLLSVVGPDTYKLLRRNTHWRWAVSEEEAFIKSKTMLLSSNLLVHFDPSLELTLACDASPYGVGAVLAHRTADGVEKPIGFVSRTLTSAEKNYSQLEREGLACIFGLMKFHSYLFGHPFTIYTDNLPIKSLFSEIAKLLHTYFK